MNTTGFSKTLALLCVLCLLAGGLPALAQEDTLASTQLFGSSLLDINDSIKSMAIEDGTAYILTGRALYSWLEGESGAAYIADVPQERYDAEDSTPRMDVLFVHEGKLMGLNAGRGIVYTLTLSNGELSYDKSLALDWSDFERSEGSNPVYYESPANVLYHDGRLYAKLSNWGSDLKNDLFSFDLKEGTKKAYTPNHIWSLVPYRDGKLIGFYFDQNRTNPETFEQYPAEPVLFDPETDSTEPFSLILPQAARHSGNQDLRLYYQAETDSIYAANETGLFRLSKDSDPILTDRLPMAGSWSGNQLSPGILPWQDDRLLISYGPNAFLRSMDESKLRPVTTLKANTDFYGSAALTRTLMQLDDIVLEVSQGDWENADAIASRFLSGRMEYDILSIDSWEFDTQAMIKKGYFSALGDISSLKAFADDVFDFFDPFIFKDGELYLLPTTIDTYFPAAYAKSMKEVGAQIPHSIPELLDLARWWAQHYQEHEGYILFEEPDTKANLKQIAYRAYMDELLGEGEPLQFDMERFGATMKEIDALDVSGFDIRHEDLGEEDYYIEGKPLIMNAMGYQLEFIDEYYTNLELSFDGTAPAWRSASARYIGIPSTSTNQEAAKRFLSIYIDNLDPVEHAVLSKTQTEPIPNLRYDEEYANQLATLEQYENLAAKAIGAEKTQFEKDVAYMKERLETFEQKNKYTVSKENLAYHKDLMSRICLPDSLGRVQRNALERPDDDQFLIYQYFEGAITLEKFIDEINAKIRLMTLEAQ